MAVDEYATISVLGFADPVSSWTHLVGATLALILGLRLITRFRGSNLHRSGLVVFVFATVFLLSMSGVYHLLSHGSSGRYVLQHLDHAAIWVMIAGTFTPIHLMLFKGWKRWGILAFIWVAAITGLVLKTVFFDGFPEWLGLILYLGMGWAGLFSGILLAREYGIGFIRLLAYGGISYSVGAILEFIRAPTIFPGIIGAHELFHFAIIFAIVCHWRFIEVVVLEVSQSMGESTKSYESE